MNLLKRLFTGLIFILLALCFFALVTWEWQLQYAAGSFGGAKFSEYPGLASFVLMMQAGLGAMFLKGGVGMLLRKDDPAESDAAPPVVGTPAGAACILGAALLALFFVAVGLWAAAEMAGMVFHLLRDDIHDTVSRLFLGACLSASVGVFVYLFATMLGGPLYAYWAPRVRLALAYLRERSK